MDIWQIYNIEKVSNLLLVSSALFGWCMYKVEQNYCNSHVRVWYSKWEDEKIMFLYPKVHFLVPTPLLSSLVSHYYGNFLISISIDGSIQHSMFN